MVIMANPNHVGEVHFKIMVLGSEVEMTIRTGQKMDLSQTFSAKDLANCQDLKNLLANRTLIKL